jgi:pSer/pThr/pTyr-binding forkhead associated (FHA) protein
LDSGVVLEDLGSTNGVYLNGVRVNKRDRLHAGDRIVIGTTELSVFSI